MTIELSAVFVGESSMKTELKNMSKVVLSQINKESSLTHLNKDCLIKMMYKFQREIRNKKKQKIWRSKKKQMKRRKSGNNSMSNLLKQSEFPNKWNKLKKMVEMSNNSKP
jgi:hypothetical protein